MEIKALIPILVQGSLFLLLTSIGMRSRWSDLVYAIQRPSLLLRGIAAVNIIVPLVALIAAFAFPLSPTTRAGIVVMAVSPLAPFVPGKMLKAGAGSGYTIGVYIALILLAIVIVPLTLALLTALGIGEAQLPVTSIARLVLMSILLPILVGMAIAALAPNVAHRFAPAVNIAAMVVLALFMIAVLYVAGGLIFALLENGALLAIIITVGAALAAGHWLGGPEPDHRIALAAAAATRHPGIAALIAHENFDDQRVILAIALFLLVSVVLSGIYMSWATKRLTAAAPDAGAMPADPG